MAQRIVVSLEATINLGNYENIKPGFSIETFALADDEVDAAIIVLSEQLSNHLIGFVERRLENATGPHANALRIWRRDYANLPRPTVNIDDLDRETAHHVETGE